MKHQDPLKQMDAQARISLLCANLKALKDRADTAPDRRAIASLANKARQEGKVDLNTLTQLAIEFDLDIIPRRSGYRLGATQRTTHGDVYLCPDGRCSRRERRDPSGPEPFCELMRRPMNIDL